MGFHSRARVTKSRSIARVVAPPAPQIFAPSAAGTLTLTGQTPEPFLAAWRPSASATLTLTGQTPTWSYIAALPTIVRYYAARLTPGFVDNDPVGTLPELISGTYGLTKFGGLDANRPTFKTNVVMGQPAIFWSGLVANMALQSASWAAISQPFTIFIIFKDSGSVASVFHIGADATHRAELNRSSTPGAMEIYGGTGVHTFAGAADTTSWHVYIENWDGASTEVWKDGTSLGGSDLGTFSLSQVTLGAWFAGGGPITGYIAEWGLLTGSATPSIRSTINTYAHDIYGITIP